MKNEDFRVKNAHPSGQASRLRYKPYRCRLGTAGIAGGSPAPSHGGTSYDL